MQLRNKFIKIFTRHPLLYYFRYLLLSKNGKADNMESVGCFNDINTIDTIPELYFEINRRMNLDPEMETLEKALEMGRYLRANVKGGRGLGLSSGQTLEKMLTGQGGVCSDFSQIFCIFCFINGIKVREWGCVDSLYKGSFGHSFNEIYSTERQKWIAIDIHKSIVFLDASQQHLSAVELFRVLRAGKPVSFAFFSDYVPPKQERLAWVYSKDTIPFLIDNYSSAVNDHFCNRFKKFPPLVINGLMILSRKNYKFVFVLDNYRVKLLPKRLQRISFIGG
jgi:Transglutaminase-like superfamily